MADNGAIASEHIRAGTVALEVVGGVVRVGRDHVLHLEVLGLLVRPSIEFDLLALRPTERVGRLMLLIGNKCQTEI